jgi:hypothetical protein
MNIPLGIAPEPPRHRLRWSDVVIALLFAALTLFLTTEANRFPSTYHPDEPSKARQVLDHEYNFHHPMLLLSSTQALMTLGHVPSEQEAVTIAGRWASALFTAGAVFFLVLLAALLSNSLGGFIAGCLLATNHELFELAHYFKEDPALLVGLSAFFVALLCYDRNPGKPGALALGAALGLAISGKYLGALVAPMAFVLIWLRRDRSSAGAGSALCLAGMLAVIAIANLPILLNPGGFADGFEREVDFAVLGHKGITRSVPHGVYWKIFIDATTPEIWNHVRIPAIGVLLLISFTALALRRRFASAAERMIILYPVGFGLLLSFFPKTHHRYFLPATAVLLVVAALGAVLLAQILWKGRPLFGRVGAPWPPLLALAAALAIQAPTFFAYYNGFRLDGRAAMAEYLHAHVPEGTTIVQDKRVDLDALKLPYDFQGKLFAADVGSIDDLRARHIEYVAVAEGDYGRFFEKALRPTDSGFADYMKRRAFYEQLFKEGNKVFECPPGQLQYLQPHLMLYRLPTGS